MRTLQIASAFLLTFSVTAQNAWVGMPFYEEAIRNAQLMGEISENASLCIRPLQLRHATELEQGFYELAEDLYESEFDVQGIAEHDQYDAVLTVLPAHFTHQYNPYHPYGWSDGLMVPNKGHQLWASGGIHARYGWLEIQVAPEMLYAANDSFMTPPARTGNIDNPERFGVNPIQKINPGQSYVKVNSPWVGIGVSHENLWWGPGQRQAILMSNNAPGFWHGTLHTTKPIETPIGSIEAQMVGGRLSASGLYPYETASDDTWPPQAPVIRRDTSWVETEWKYLNGLVVNYQPKWLPGLHVGVIRSVLYGSDDLTSFTDYIQAFLPILKVTSGEDGGQRNQLMSGYFRYVFPESHAELYAEYGREDAAWDLEDLLNEPEHTRAYLWGFRKIQPLNEEERLEVNLEMVTIQQGTSFLFRARNYSFYTHGLIGGYTHEGQVLGAGIGPGGNSQTATAIYRKGYQALGLRLERFTHNNDLFYSGALSHLRLNDTPYAFDASKHWVDVSGTLIYQDEFGPWWYSAELQLMQTYNYNWQYDPNGELGIFRFPGWNVFQTNLRVRALYRF